MAQSTIEWTESTWNPVTGCDDASPGCENCYARRMARRLEAMGAYNYRNGFQLTLQPQMLDRPLRWRKPQRVLLEAMLKSYATAAGFGKEQVNNGRSGAQANA